MSHPVRHPGIGRPHGEYHGAAKLTERQVRWLRRVLATHQATLQQVAQDLGVCASAVSDAARGVTWSHVPGALPRVQRSAKLWDPETMPVGKDGEHDTSHRARRRKRLLRLWVVSLLPLASTGCGDTAGRVVSRPVAEADSAYSYETIQIQGSSFTVIEDTKRRVLCYRAGSSSGLALSCFPYPKETQ